MTRVDLTVRGGGIFGLSIAFACARRGARVRLVETAAIGAGCSGGVVGALPVTLLFMAIQTRLIAGMTQGAVKG